MRIRLFVLSAMFFCLTGAVLPGYASATFSVASLNGSYRIGELDGMLFQPDGASVRTIVGGNDIRVSFNGAGSCSVVETWRQFEEGFAPGSSSTLYDQVTANFDSPTSPSTCSYTVTPEGEMAITLDGTDVIGGWHVSADGNNLLKSAVYSERTGDDNGTMYMANIFAGIKLGSAMNNASLNGSYKLGEIVTTLYKPDNLPVKTILGGNDIRLTFNGAGACTLSSSWKEFEEGFNPAGTDSLLYDYVSLNPDPPFSPICSYTVAPDGATTLILDGEEAISGMHVSADGASLLKLEVFSERTGDNNGDFNSAHLFVGTKLGSAMNNASLSGLFKVVEIDASLKKPNGDSVRSLVEGSDGWMTFNGAGACSVSSSWKEYAEGFSTAPASTLYDQVNLEIDEPYSPSCTYNVSAEGAVTLTLDNEDLTGWHVSANGKNLLRPEVLQRTNSSNTATLYDVSLSVGTKIHEVIHNACGSSNGGTFAAVPSTNLCSGVAPSQVTGSGPWNWICEGQYGGNSASCSANIQNYQLTLSFAGNGSGSVSGDMACTSGEPCQPVSFAANTQINLIPLADSSSVFNGWSGACTNTTGNCQFSMSSAKSVTATFAAAPKVKVGAAGFATIQAAYNDASTQSGAIIKLLEGTLTENPIFNLGKTVILEGGYNSSFGAVSTETVIDGTLNLRAGTVRVKGVNVK